MNRAMLALACWRRCLVEHRRVLTTRATSPEWQAAHSAWLNASKSLAVAIVNQAARQEARHVA